MFPVPEQVTSTGTLTSTPLAFDLPDNPVSDDVFAVFVNMRDAANGVVNTPSGWTRITGNTTGNRYSGCFARVSDGTETSISLAINSGSKLVQVAADLYRRAELGAAGITGLFGTFANTSFDPPNLAPGVGAQDFRWVTCCTGGSGTLVAPTGFTLFYSPTTQSRMAAREERVASLNPAAWTGSGSDGGTIIVAIQGATDPSSGGAIMMATARDAWKRTRSGIYMPRLWKPRRPGLVLG